MDFKSKKTEISKLKVSVQLIDYESTNPFFCNEEGSLKNSEDFKIIFLN